VFWWPGATPRPDSEYSECAEVPLNTNQLNNCWWKQVLLCSQFLTAFFEIFDLQQYSDLKTQGHSRSSEQTRIDPPLMTSYQRSIVTTPPLPFGRICFVVLVMRKGGESSWSGPWHLGCTLVVFHVHSYQDQFIQPGGAECFCVHI